MVLKLTGVEVHWCQQLCRKSELIEVGPGFIGQLELQMYIFEGMGEILGEDGCQR
jgi:hypothetical protein